MKTQQYVVFIVDLHVTKTTILTVAKKMRLRWIYVVGQKKKTQVRLHVKGQICIQFEPYLVVYRQIFIKVSNIKFRGNPSTWSRVDTCGQTDITKLRDAPCRYARESKNTMCSMGSVTALHVRRVGVWWLTAQRYWLASGECDWRVWLTSVTVRLYVQRQTTWSKCRAYGVGFKQQGTTI
jgi:hypothetical protein